MLKKNMPHEDGESAMPELGHLLVLFKRQHPCPVCFYCIFMQINDDDDDDSDLYYTSSTGSNTYLMWAEHYAQNCSEKSRKCL